MDKHQVSYGHSQSEVIGVEREFNIEDLIEDYATEEKDYPEYVSKSEIREMSKKWDLFPNECTLEETLVFNEETFEERDYPEYVSKSEIKQIRIRSDLFTSNYPSKDTSVDNGVTTEEFIVSDDDSSTMLNLNEEVIEIEDDETDDSKSNLDDINGARNVSEVFPCNLCSHTSNCRNGLLKHMKDAHFGINSCEVCDYKTRCRSDLKRHIKRKHMKAELYKCNVCDYKSNERWNLKMHMIKHSESERVKCHICGNEYKHELYLRQHLKRMHKIKL